MNTIIIVIILIILLPISLGLFRNWQTLNSPSQELFLNGKIPNPKLSGAYKGSFESFKTSWQGKKFDPSTSFHSDDSSERAGQVQYGVNIIDGKEKFPFKTYVGKGLQDNIDVLKIDYNIPGNPLWVKLLLDELVEIKPGKYLGKVHINLIPGLPFLVEYFRLEK